MPYTDNNLYEFASRLEALAPLCDPEFDIVYEDFDREFAHHRLHASDGGSNA